MGLVLPADVYERMNHRMGFVPLREITWYQPNHSDAKAVEQMLKTYDPCLEMGVIRSFDEVDKWAINRRAPDGSQVLVRTLENSDGSYRSPHYGDYTDIQRSDFHGRHGKEVLKRVQSGEERWKAQKEKMRAEDEGMLAELAEKRLKDFGTSQWEVEDRHQFAPGQKLTQHERKPRKRATGVAEVPKP